MDSDTLNGFSSSDDLLMCYSCENPYCEHCSNALRYIFHTNLEINIKRNATKVTQCSVVYNAIGSARYGCGPKGTKHFATHRGVAMGWTRVDMFPPHFFQRVS